MTAATFRRTSSAFAMTCEVEIGILASAEIVWNLLSDAQGFSRWNSTVAGIEGHIREGERLKLRVPGTNRTFTPTVSDVVPARCMTWSDGVAPVFRGVRTFALRPRDDNTTDFVMAERFSGVVLPSRKACCRISALSLRPTPTI